MPSHPSVNSEGSLLLSIVSDAATKAGYTGYTVVDFSSLGPESNNQIAFACLSRLDHSLKPQITCTSPEPSVYIGHGPTHTAMAHSAGGLGFQ